MNLEGQNIEYKRIWKDEYLKWVSGFANAQLIRPSFVSEQGGITTIIPREVFMSVRDTGVINPESQENGENRTVQEPSKHGTKTDTKPIQNRYKPIQTDTKPIQTELPPYRYRTKAEERAFILEVIKANPLVSMDSLSVLLKVTKSSVQRRLEVLVKEGRLRHVGPTNGGFWEVMDKDL